tara:strand:- start:55348 stop:56658 length:1311 start_codon:yes stop_codon:yes gene_type:complete
MRSSLLLFVCLIIPACDSDVGGALDAGQRADVDASASEADAMSSDVLLPDPCAETIAQCPIATVSEGAGLLPVDRCAFPMQARDTWGTNHTLIESLSEQLATASLSDVLTDLNRVGIASSTVAGNPPGLQQAFRWQAGDENVEYWIPQGIATSANAVDGGRVDNKHVAMVSWYYKLESDEGSQQEKGVRIAIADTTDPDNVRYRFVLLAEPIELDGQASFKAVNVHAGGLAWVGDYLYVVHTGVGLRIFDLTRMLRVSTGADTIGFDAESTNYYAHNYAYVLPQVETIAHASECAPRYSFLSVDRTTEPMSLLSGEYDATSVGARLHRWPLHADTGRPALVEGMRLYPDEAFISGQSHLQGALSVNGTYYLSSSKPPQGAGVLYKTAPNTPTVNRTWNDSPEDLAYDPQRNSIWSLSEDAGQRFVFRVNRDDLQTR